MISRVHNCDLAKMAVLLVFFCGLAFLVSDPALARMEYTNSWNSAEGDPGDGDDSMGGGGGSIDLVDDTFVFHPVNQAVYSLDSIIFLDYLGTSYPVILFPGGTYFENFEIPHLITDPLQFGGKK